MNYYRTLIQNILESLYINLIHLYSFEESTGTVCYDSYVSGTPINGTYIGTSSLENSSPLGRAASFNGTNASVQFGSNLGITSLNVSMALLVYLPDITATRYILSGANSNTYLGIGIIQNAATIIVRYGQGGAPSSATRKDFISSSNLVVGWNRIIILCPTPSGSFAGTAKVSIYINGILNSNLASGSGSATSVNLSSASYTIAKQATFHLFKISELWIWNKILTNNEAIALDTYLQNGTYLINPITN